MNDVEHADAATLAIVARTEDRLRRYRARTVQDTDRLFAGLLFGEWIFAIVLALVVAPYTWTGAVRGVSPHVWVAIVLGAIVISFPIALAMRRPGEVLTRHVIAGAQMLMSALFIHLSGGRIETHFSVFCSLAVLAFYLDPWVLLTATAVVVVDHLVRGLVWPVSVYGTPSPEWWRFGEHAGWVVVCVAFLTQSIRRQLREWKAAAEEGGLVEAMAEAEWKRSSVLDRDKRAAAAAESSSSAP